jgi:hypothetical protein
MLFKVEVEGFSEDADIPIRCTCDGDDLSPALHWIGEQRALHWSWTILMRQAGSGTTG